MTLILTLVAPANSNAISTALSELVKIGVLPGGTSWLARDIALDIRLSDRPDFNDLAPVLESAGVDWSLQDEDKRGKMLFLSDMDSTMIQQECIDELADMMGIGDQIKAVTERAMQGELDFDSSLRERVAALKGLPEADLKRCYKERIILSQGAETLLSTLKNLSIRACLVSGGFTWFTSQVAAEIGFDKHRANILLQDENGALTGKVEEPVLGPSAKLELLEEECASLSIDRDQVIAIGDGANDLPMLEAAGLGIAYKAKPAVRAKTNARIDFTDLTSVLYFMGLPNSAFAEE